MTQTINCEKCGHENDIEKTLGKKISSELHLKYKSRYQDREIELDKKSQSLAEREKARNEKDFAKADSIRDELKEKGIILEDSPQGVRWKKV